MNLLRKTYVGRDVSAGCHQCGGTEPLWTGKNAQGVAARHHDATGHTTWVDVYMTITYGENVSYLDQPKSDQC